MPQLFIILIKINLVLALFAIAYYLILRRLTFYVLNRVFLVFGILFSSLYPFIDLTKFFHNQHQLAPQLTELVPAINQRVQEMAPAGFMTKYHQHISFLFYIGIAVMAIRFLLQFVSLYRLHKNSSRGLVNGMPVRILAEPVSPFSFWQTIYLNPGLHSGKDLPSILAHEHIHVKQWHTLDIILAELSVVFYWFNPGAWLMRKAVKENLEFITDEQVLKKGIDRKAYQYSLLDTQNGIVAATFTNSFNISDIKKRIIRMNARPSSRLTLGRYVLVIPVLLATTLLFTVSKKQVIKYLRPVLPQYIYSPSVSEPGNDLLTTTKRTAAKATKRQRIASLSQQDNTAVTEYEETAGNQFPDSRSLVPTLVNRTRLDSVKGITDNRLYKKVYFPKKYFVLPTANKGKDNDEVAVMVGYSLRLWESYGIELPSTLSPEVVKNLPPNTRLLKLPNNLNDNKVRVVTGRPLNSKKPQQ